MDNGYLRPSTKQDILARKKAVKGVRGKERRYKRKAINMPEGKRRYK